MGIITKQRMEKKRNQSNYQSKQFFKFNKLIFKNKKGNRVKRAVKTVVAAEVVIASIRNDPDPDLVLKKQNAVANPKKKKRTKRKRKRKRKLVIINIHVVEPKAEIVVVNLALEHAVDPEIENRIDQAVETEIDRIIEIHRVVDTRELNHQLNDNDHLN